MLLDENSASKPEIVRFIKTWAQLKAVVDYQDFKDPHAMTRLGELAGAGLLLCYQHIEDLFEERNSNPDWTSQCSDLVSSLVIHLDYNKFLEELETTLENINAGETLLPGYKEGNVSLLRKLPPIKVFALAQRVFSGLIVAEMGLYTDAKGSFNPLKGYYPDQLLTTILELSNQLNVRK